MEKIVEYVVRITRSVASAAVLLMVGVTVVSVVGRQMRLPLFGAEEMVAFLSLAALAASLPYCHVHRAHIGVELVVRRLSPRAQRWAKGIRDSISFFLWGVMAIALGRYAWSKLDAGAVSLNLGWPEGWVVAVLAVGVGLTAAIMLVELVQTLRRRS
jgi:TRAP-type C4-dicarboxylate transport system permease small subunit